MIREGRILICQRKEGRHALKWEFPGGKVEAGESPAAALIRELREELAIEAANPVEIMRYEFAYPGRHPILLIFLKVTEWTRDPENLIFKRILWELPTRLRDYDFLEGDERFLAEFPLQ
jgi:8-oxo-dGTP diphosphatase